MAERVDGATVVAAIGRAAKRMEEMREYLTGLDAAMGDGDLGITAAKGAAAVCEHLAATAPGEDLGKFIAGLGLVFNRAASSTMGTLIATALMRAGKEAGGLSSLDGTALARMLAAADRGIQERGKAALGDKTVIDALHPAAEAFAAAVARGDSLAAAGQALLAAARKGRDAVIPLQSKVGRAAWVGERTVGRPDPGTVLFVQMVEAVLDVEYSEPGSSLH
ncbi:MAG: DAK2 domain-containing protein [Anaerolineae bacterium]